MNNHRIVSSALAVVAACGLMVGTAGSVAADPRPDPWIQGQIDSLTENVPGYLDAINTSGVDRGGIDDRDLVIKGHVICNQIYSARGDLSGAMLPHTRTTDFHSMEVVAGAGVKYLCPPAGRFVSPGILHAVP